MADCKSGIGVLPRRLRETASASRCLGSDVSGNTLLLGRTTRGVHWVDLSTFLDRSAPHETSPVQLDPQLRLCAYGGMGLMGVLLCWLALGHHVGNSGTRPGFLIVGYGAVVGAFQFGGHAALIMVLLGLGLVGGIGLAVYTKDFASTPEWGHYGAFGLASLGALSALPMLLTVAVCLLNLVLWILFGILMAVLFVAAVCAGVMILIGIISDL